MSDKDGTLIGVDKIKDLISLKQEGSYWDFKKEWYKSNSKGKQDLHLYG